jgi:hypothetical protein
MREATTNLVVAIAHGLRLTLIGAIQARTPAAEG